MNEEIETCQICSNELAACVCMEEDEITLRDIFLEEIDLLNDHDQLRCNDE
jgi:hypothetical protein